MRSSDVLFENHEIEAEFARCVQHFGVDDPYDTDETVGLFDVLRAHYLVCDYFFTVGSGLGGLGPRDPDLLHSAVYRQFVSYGGVDKWKTPEEKAATLVFGVITDHPFHDANKRTGLLLLLLALKKMRRLPEVRQRDLEDLAVEIADKKLNKYPRYKEMRRSEPDPEVRFIADYIKRNSRREDRTSYTIIYRELNRRLHDFGYRLDNAKNNYIDVVRITERRKLFGFGRREQVNVKVCQIGFPGWKKQVNQSAIATVRKEARLRPEDGIDSKVFFLGADPVHALIDTYSGPLERLANR